MIFEILNKFEKLIVCANDAGGANILACFVAKHELAKKSQFVLSGPAIKIFKEYIGNDISLSDEVHLCRESNLLLTATSGDCDLERNMIAKAKEKGVCSISFLDHWINYRQRFVMAFGKNEQTAEILPDYIVVCDKQAFNLALQERFSATKIIQIENPYIEYVVKEFNLIKKSTGAFLLFVAEYFSEKQKAICNEQDYLITILNELREINKKYNQNLKLRLRLHPSEEQHKYAQIQSQYSELEFCNPKNSLVEDLAATRVVLGKSSMALYVSMRLGIKTFALEYNNILPSNLSESVPRINSLNEIVNLIVNINESVWEN